MLDIIPNAEQMTALVGKPLYEVWEKLCALIDERYAMEAAWNRGGKAWTYLLAGVLRNVYHAINPVPFPHRIQLLRFVGIGRLRCGAGWRRGSLCRRRLAGDAPEGFAREASGSAKPLRATHTAAQSSRKETLRFISALAFSPNGALCTEDAFHPPRCDLPISGGILRGGWRQEGETSQIP